jgi:4-amino-4-deoxy-L-arabinose transferase-like glycosyltransferase
VVNLEPVHVALALAVAHLALVVLSILPIPHDGGDNASYLALAQSLREHGTFREMWDPANRPHTQYPPAYPLILAGALTLGIKPWIGFKLIVALFSAAAIALSYLWARRVTTAGTALGVGLLLAFGTGVIDRGRWELSDVPFWAFTMLALWAFARLAPRDPADAPAPAAEPAEPAPEATVRRARWKTLLGPLALASAGTLLAYATRSAGLPLVVAGAAWLAWRRDWRRLAAFAAVIAPFAVVWTWRNSAVGGPSYTGYLWYVDPYRPVLGTVGVGGILERITVNVVKYTTEHVSFLLTGTRFGAPATVLGIVVVVLAIAGWGMRVRRAGAAELWLPLYMGLVLVWPAEWAGNRFLLPALPMLLVCAAEPIRALVPRGHRRMAGVAIVGALLLATTVQLQRQLATAAKCRAAYDASNNPYPCLPETWADLLDVARTVNGALPEGSAVLARKATLFWAYSGYPSRTYPFTADPDTLLAAAREAKAQYVLLDYMDNLSVMYLAPVLMQRPQAFCVMHAAGPGRATLMAILPGAEQMPNVRDRPGNETANVPFTFCTKEFWGPGHAPSGTEAAGAPDAAP